ncbi:hypothetical protein Back11_14440 [Paenibacillus baekrokdamisoli]|uniref:Uncharacterized protein n=1 Tax=Paenibacillus baekrokdamisoli TaxID=1712516 RepID=A0A3G9JAQ8_9BACL|nr:hypothetical protein [Paenibacillus baekrokdamisoli]MBB3070750.1 hypothetical protein [Paenibacillus baekrokdamisoli]BBH20099.1 hypothetical protein Back11_14440 [Paenibacillus baekrokdamisoli]
MTETLIRKPLWLWFAVVAVMILMADTTIVRISASGSPDDRLLIYAVLFDFMLVIPFLYWMLVVRRKSKSISAILPLPVLGALTAWLALPGALRHMVWSTAWPVELLLLTAEALFIGYEIRLLMRLVRRFWEVRASERDTGEALRITVKGGMGDGIMASILLHDLSLIYYLFFSWKRKKIPPSSADLADREYSYTKQSNQVMFAAILTKIIVFEGVFVHLFVQQWSHPAAWVLSAADVWLLALLWADCRASVLNPVRIRKGVLNLRYGLRIQADIPISLIADSHSTREFTLDAKSRKGAALPLFAAPNVRLRLRQPVLIQGLLFLPSWVDTIYLTLDDPEPFVRSIHGTLE